MFTSASNEKRLMRPRSMSFMRGMGHVTTARDFGLRPPFSGHHRRQRIHQVGTRPQVCGLFGRGGQRVEGFSECLYVFAHGRFRISSRYRLPGKSISACGVLRDFFWKACKTNTASRSRAGYITRNARLPRFNTTYECGLAIGARHFNATKAHDALVLARTKFQDKVSSSDQAGIDPGYHNGDSKISLSFSRRPGPTARFRLDTTICIDAIKRQPAAVLAALRRHEATCIGCG